VKEIFDGWLRAHEPRRAEKVLSLIRQTHGGRLYDPKFGERMRGHGPYADMLRRRFEVARRRHGFRPDRFTLDALPSESRHGQARNAASSQADLTSSARVRACDSTM
jgi:DNA repair photolyase